MPATVIPVTGINEGFVGNISSEGYSLRVPRTVNPADTLNIAFGESLVLNNNNTYSSVASFIAGSGTLTASTRLGIAVANTKTNGTFPLNGSNDVLTPGGFFTPGQVCDALVQGTIDVFCNVGTPTGAGGAVYVRVALNGAFPAGVVGGFEAVADGSNTVLLTNVVWKTGIAQPSATTVFQATILARQIP
jgi:hypothetical protein